MLDVNTLPKRYRKVEELMFDECYSQLRFRSKRTEEGRQKYFKTNALVPKKAVLRKEEGATVAATPYLLLSWLSHQAGPAAFFHGCLQNSGKLH
jgi:hypothetical protein